MKFRKEIRFDAPVEQVHAMLVTKEFREQVAAAAGSGATTVTVEETSTGIRSVVDSQVPTAGLPGFVRTVAGSELGIHQEELYTSTTEGTLAVSLVGKPGNFRGTIRLAADGAGTVQTVQADVKVSIPLVGSKLEKLICQVMGNLLKLQGSVGAEWLSRS